MNGLEKLSLNKGRFTVLIDSEDLERVSSRRWYVAGNGYVYSQTMIEGVKHIMLLHRFIMNCPKECVVDHKDHNPLNNSKVNLRICSRRQNGQNCRIDRKNNTSGYRGVYWNARRSKWQVGVKINGRCATVGYFDCKEAAARHFNKKAQELYGEFAVLNEVCA